MATSTLKSCHFSSQILFNYLVLIWIFLVPEFAASYDDDRKVYIVYMGHNSQSEISSSSFHTSMLNRVVASDGSKYLRHSYSRSFHGFSAKLTSIEARKLAGMKGVVSVFLSKKHELHTTKSWDFLSMPLDVKRATIESDMIVGVLDTGIWPESESFSDKGYGPPPTKWKGTCKNFSNFTCNNKLIGARYYKADGNFTNMLKSPRDSDGHGSHTASTAAGNLVPKTSFGGIRLGTARGGVPRARISAYKVCWSDGCQDENILAAFDDAIADGVDIISLSVGGNNAQNYLSDGIAIGAFHAMKKGILTSQSANNNGPYPQTTSSVAPWILSVAASTMESKLVTPVKLGNHAVYNGVSINTFNLDRMYPLIDSADAPNTKAGFTNSTSKFCAENSLNKELVKGKIVLCHTIGTGSGGLAAGASGLIMQDLGPYFDLASIFPLPAAAFKSNESTTILNYIKSTSKPTAVITKTVEVKDSLAPYVSTFSGRGPNSITDTILKPDISAPGVAILAAYSPLAHVSDAPEDKRSVPYKFISGTSMACPHISGIAAYIKSFHPTWSPAAIKSAIMTTADPITNGINTDAEFAYGSGHVNPLKALDPGLIYDASEDDYVKFMCGEGYSTKQVRQVTGNKKSNCSSFKDADQNDLNYPSFVVSAMRNVQSTVKFTRTLTNVGLKPSNYTVTRYYPLNPRFTIEIEPKVLEFKSIGEKKSYKMSVDLMFTSTDIPIISCYIIWRDGVHEVRSPVVLHVPT